jgi:hypothetical protein
MIIMPSQDMLMIGSRSILFDYKFNKTTGKQISAGAGPGGSALTVAQSRAQLSMWSILKSPLLASANLALVSSWKADPAAPEKGSGLELIEVLKNTEVLAVSDDPLGKEAVRLEDIPCGGSGGVIKSSPDVYVGEMVGGKYAVALFNRRNGPTNMTLALQDLSKLPSHISRQQQQQQQQQQQGGQDHHHDQDHDHDQNVDDTTTTVVPLEFAVRDLWAHSDNGTVTITASGRGGLITVLVGAYDVVMLTLTPTST